MSNEDKDEDTELKARSQVLAENWEEKHARDRGIFTDTDRKYLFGIKQYENHPAMRSRRRGAIHERVVDGIRDLYYLPMIDSDQWEDIFDDLNERTDPTGNLRFAVSRLIEFLYKSDAVSREWLEETIAAGIDEAERTMYDDKYRDGGASVQIDPPRKYNLNELEERIDEDGAELTPAEVGVLVKAGRIEPEELGELKGGTSPWDMI